MLFLQLAFGVRWQHYELWSGIVNLSLLATINEEDDDKDLDKPSPFVLVKCHSPDMVGVQLSYLIFTIALKYSHHI